ncbi:APC family permease [Streptomyces scabiei]|uniref:APC family permease n=1 Tax=Streptomyces scabiei TaxID=1930 RepID=UPI0029AE1F2B|nr:APC family permease [Streptomyces scabiei]MDX3522704.1 APC family permease [Streptomyces scabiei]
MTDTQIATTELRRNAVGVSGIVFFVVAAAAPLAATLGASPVAFASVGIGAPSAYLIIGVVLILFAVGYAAMSRHVTSSAGFAAYLEAAFGRVAGFVGASVALLAYNCMLIGLYGFFGFLTNTVVSDLFGFDLDWTWWTLIAWAAVSILGYLEINLSAKVLGVLMVCEVLILLIFDLAVFVRGGADGLSVESFTPDNAFASGVGIAVLFAAASFVGFEATAIYGEEAREPERTVPRATYLAVVLIAVFYTISTWAISLAYGGGSVRDAAANDPAGFVFAVNDQFVNHFSTDVMKVLLITSTFAVVLAFHNTLSRYMFALARSGALPAPLGHTHPRSQSPHGSSLVGSVITVAVLAIFMLADADPFAQLYSWLVGIGTLGVVLIQAVTAVAVVIFFLRKRRDRFRIWTTAVAPALGAVGLFAAAYLAIENWTILTGATSGLPKDLPWVVAVAAVLGLVWAYVTRNTARSFADGFSDSAADESRALIHNSRTTEGE